VHRAVLRCALQRGEGIFSPSCSVLTFLSPGRLLDLHGAHVRLTRQVLQVYNASSTVEHSGGNPRQDHGCCKCCNFLSFDALSFISFFICRRWLHWITWRRNSRSSTVTWSLQISSSTKLGPSSCVTSASADSSWTPLPRRGTLAVVRTWRWVEGGSPVVWCIMLQRALVAARENRSPEFVEGVWRAFRCMELGDYFDGSGHWAIPVPQVEQCVRSADAGGSRGAPSAARQWSPILWRVQKFHKYLVRTSARKWNLIKLFPSFTA
jgi:hypothetical protein